jgi:signal transduction histidine kinase
VPAGIAFLDRDLIFRRVNRAYCEMWQMAPDQFIGRQVYDVFPRITRSGHFDKVLATHEPLEVKNVAYPQRQDGAVRETVWDITFVPVLEGDELIGIQVFTVEVSPRVEAERLKDERLRRLQEVDRLKDDFVSATSHELRTPLTSIMGFAEFLQDEVEGPLTEGQRAFLCAIQGSVLRLQRVVDDLLDFARIESGTVELQRADVDLVELLRRELVTVEPQARDKDLTLLADLGDSPVVANVDPQRLGQVVLNLLANAVKFSAPGGKVALRLIPEVQGPRIEVVDTGPGIPPESIPRLFERFYQVDPSLTRQHGGAGLGLAIARALVEAHEGLIGVESELGRGSTFWVSLPASAAP